MNQPLLRFAWFLSLVLALCAGSVTARAGVHEDKTLSPYFFVKDGDPSVDHLPLKDTRVAVSIAGVVADVTVRQIYKNEGARPIHARYVFPASTKAAVHGLSMTVGDTRIAAKIAEREKAKEKYEKAKQEGKSASLLEQDRPNVFTMSLANLMPGDLVEVELHYTEFIAPVDGVYEFSYPTVVGPRYSSKAKGTARGIDAFVTSPYLHPNEAPASELHLIAALSTGVPIFDLTSPSHKVETSFAGPASARVELAASEKWGGNRDFVLQYRLSGAQVTTGLMLFEGDSEKFFLLTAEPPAVVAEDAMPPREYLFVVDVSGSMAGFPLDTAKALITKLVGGLTLRDRFNIVTFADGSAVFARQSIAATPQDIQRGLDFLHPQRGGGGTELLAALERAVAIPRDEGVSRSIVLITDGYVEAEKEVFSYIERHLDRANLFAFGIGSSVNRYLLDGVARAGRGVPFVVTKPEEAATEARRFLRYVRTPVLANVHVTFDGFDAYDVEPSRVPDLFASRPIVVFGKWRGEPRGAVVVEGTRGAEPYRVSLPIQKASIREEHRALRLLWARSRLASLSDYGADESPSATQEITRIGLQYGLLTRHTSFVAVREVVRTASSAALAVDQPLPMPSGVSDTAVGEPAGEPVIGGAEPELLWLVAGVVLVALAGIRVRTSSPARA